MRFASPEALITGSFPDAALIIVISLTADAVEVNLTNSLLFASLIAVVILGDEIVGVVNVLLISVCVALSKIAVPFASGKNTVLSAAGIPAAVNVYELPKLILIPVLSNETTGDNISLSPPNFW